MENEIESIDKLKQVESLLDEYEHKIHLDKISVVDPDIDISRETLLSLHYEDLQGLAWQLGQYSLALQRESNRHQSRFSWAEANLKRYLEREANNYSGWAWTERQAEALNCSEYAQRLNNLKIRSKLAIDRLAFLPSKVQFLSELIRDIMKTKRYKNVECND